MADSFADSITESERKAGVADRGQQPAVVLQQVIGLGGMFYRITKIVRQPCGRWEVHFEPWEAPTLKSCKEASEHARAVPQTR